MKRSISPLLILYAAAALFVVFACRKEPPAPAPPSPRATATSTTPPPGPAHINVPVRLAPGEISRCELGASLGDQGFVETSKLAFASREPLYVSMWLNEAPQALQVSAHLLDARGKEVAVVRKAAQGSQVATLKFDRKLKAGKYKLEGYWGGNLGCEKSVEVN